jgi:hypothetical protein
MKSKLLREADMLRRTEWDGMKIEIDCKLKMSSFVL